MLSRSFPRLPVKIAGMLAMLISGSPLLVSQTQMTEQQFISSVNSAITNFITPLTGNAHSPVIFGGQLPFAHGSAVANAPLNVLLDYADGLKAAGVQRIEFNPGVTSLSNPSTMAKYDALVQRIRQLGLRLAINPEVNPGEVGTNPTFADFQNAALPAWQQLAARYQPDNFVIIHECSTMNGRMGITASAQDWHDFVVAAGPLVKAASPHTRIGAGDYQGTTTAALDAQESMCFQEFVSNIPTCSESNVSSGCLDFVTMDVYNDDTFPQYTQWAQMAHSVGKGVYIEETWAPHDVPNPLPASYLTPMGYLSASLDSLSLVGPANADFASMDANWLQAMAIFASANGLESFTPFTTETFFSLGTAGDDKVTDPGYVQANLQAIQTGQLTSVAQAYTGDSQQQGIKIVTSFSNASYPLLTSVFSGNFANSTVAPDMLVSAFGADLATANASATSTAYPTNLGGTTTTLVDSSNTSYPVSMYAVTPLQIAYLVPSAAKPGPATITVTSSDGTVTTGIVQIAPVSPGLYTADANGKGPAAAIAVCAGTCAGWPTAGHVNGQFFQNTFTCGSTVGSCQTRPISLGASTDSVVLEIYATGVRHLSSLSAITAQVNGQNAAVSYAGAQATYPGLDQINVDLAHSLAGSGQVNVTVNVQDTVNNVTVASNTIAIDIE